jgi:hypothetical protein
MGWNKKIKYTLFIDRKTEELCHCEKGNVFRENLSDLALAEKPGKVLTIREKELEIS